MGKYQDEVRKNTRNPKRILVIGGSIAAVGIIAGIIRKDMEVAIVLCIIGGLYSLLYFYWKHKHDE